MLRLVFHSIYFLSRKKFYISERARHDMIKEAEEEKGAASLKEAEEDTSKELFHTPRPSIMRPDIMMMPR